MKNVKQMILSMRFMLRPFWEYDKVCMIVYIVANTIYNMYINLYFLLITSITLGMVENRNMTLPQIAISIILLLTFGKAYNILDGILYNQYTEPHIEHVKKRINNEVFDRLKKTDYKYFDDPEFFDKFTVTYGNFADNSQKALRTLSSIISNIVTVIALIAYIAVQNWLVIIISVITMLLNIVIEGKRNKISVERDDRTSRLEREKKYYRERLVARDSAMDIKSTYLSELFEGKYNSAVKANVKINRELDIKSNFFTLYNQLVDQGGYAIVRLTTCILVLAGKVGISAMVVLITASSELSYKMQVVSWGIRDFHKCALEGERIRGFLEMSSPIEQTEAVITDSRAVEGEFEYELKNVSFSYPNSDFALKNLNMHFKAGEKIAIVGENGGGKTTLTKLLMRLYDPQEGEILLNGRSLKDYDIEKVRHNIGIAFQDSPIYSLSMRENLSAYIPVDDETIGRVSERLPINEILHKNEATYDTQITRLFDEKGIMLSGGERQKLSVARVMTKEFGMLIFDEPTAALDPIAEEKLSQAILSTGNKTTTVLISHRLSNVVNADRIYVIRHGEVVESGTHHELMAAEGYYAEMFNMQAEKYRSET